MLSVKELIDTLWNVNTLEFTMPFDTSRINRYIMECKLKIEDRQAVVHKRINRYIMECKFIVGSKLDNIDPKELIDTLWNVNNRT